MQNYGFSPLHLYAVAEKTAEALFDIHYTEPDVAERKSSRILSTIRAAAAAFARRPARQTGMKASLAAAK